jgi:hypothetical protein
MLDLRQNEIGDEGAQYLARAFENNTVSEIMRFFLPPSVVSHIDTHHPESQQQLNQR